MKHVLVNYKGWSVKVEDSGPYGWKWTKNHYPMGIDGCQDPNCSDIESHTYRSIDAFISNPANRGISKMTPVYMYWHPDSVEELRKALGDTGDPPTSRMKDAINPPLAKQIHGSVGVVCKKCNMKNEFGAPNQKDGSYVCYVCR